VGTDFAETTLPYDPSVKVTNIEGRYVVPSRAVKVRPTDRFSAGVRGRASTSALRRVDITRRG
jgi:hypothetical protein